MFQQLEVYVSVSRNSLTEMNGWKGELSFVCCAAFCHAKTSHLYGWLVSLNDFAAN